MYSPGPQTQPAPRESRASRSFCHSPNRQTHKQTKELFAPPREAACIKKTWTSSYLASKHQRQSVVGASNFAVANHWCKTVRVLNNRGHSFQAAAVAARWGTRTGCSPGTWSDSLDQAAASIAAPWAPRSHPRAGVEATLRASTGCLRGLPSLGNEACWGRVRTKMGFSPLWWIWRG